MTGRETVGKCTKEGGEVRLFCCLGKILMAIYSVFRTSLYDYMFHVLFMFSPIMQVFVDVLIISTD
jgi:hypothetical protein